MAKLITETQFDATLRSHNLVLVDFFAEWCPPCKKLSPMLDKLSPEYENRIEFVKVDAGESPGLTREYGIRVLPTLLLFRNGKEIDRTMGLPTETAFKGKLDKFLTV